MTSSMLVEEVARVLVVDDDRTMRMLLRHALERDGYDVFEAGNGVQGLERFKHDAPDIILMDAAMPEMDGFVLCATLQKLPRGGETPVLMITGLDDDASVEQAFAAGASDYITKPVNWAVLRQRVRRMVNQRRAERHVNYLAYHDSLTGLPNRTLFIERLEHGIARARRAGSQMAVMFLDLDGFKLVNDTLGHDVGDLLLKVVAERLATCLRESDTVARLGGDEFTTILHDVVGTAEIQIAANRMLEELTRPVRLNDREVFVGASIGVAIYPADGSDVRTLLRSADMAMYRAKESGRNNFQFYNPEMGDHAVLRMSMENGARKALENDEFAAYYQPIVDLQSGRVVSFETLIRWERPGLGLVSPADFIPLAEETGLIRQLGRWILVRACTDAAGWRSRDLHPAKVSVNLSAKQLEDPGLVGVVGAILEETGHPAESLVFEITENAVMQNTDHAIPMLKELRALGVGLCIDDFGRGYSSLSQLKSLPIDTIKIDGSFLEGLPGDSDNSAIITAIVAMGHGLRMKVVAEGVETSGQVEFLRGLGCEFMQGYLPGRPVPGDAVVTMLERARDLAPPIGGQVVELRQGRV